MFFKINSVMDGCAVSSNKADYMPLSNTNSTKKSRIITYCCSTHYVRGTLPMFLVINPFMAEFGSNSNRTKIAPTIINI